VARTAAAQVAYDLGQLFPSRSSALSELTQAHSAISSAISALNTHVSALVADTLTQGQIDALVADVAALTAANDRLA